MQSKRIVSVFILLVFFSALAIGGSTVFAVAEVSVTYSLVHSESEINEVDIKLNALKGKNLILLKISDVEKILKSYPHLKLDSFKREYPNNLSINISERVGRFALTKGDDVFVIDKEGFVIARYSLKDYTAKYTALNIDAEAEIGKMLEYDLELFNGLIAASNSIDLQSGGQFNTAVKSVTVKNAYNIVFTMSEGTSISIFEAKFNADKKAAACYALFKTLTVSEKMDSRYTVLGFWDRDSGQAAANYTKDS